MRPLPPEIFPAILHAAPSAVVVVDEAGRIALLNQEAEQLFGWPNEELIGQSIELLVPEAARQDHPGHRGRYSKQPARRSMGPGRELTALHRDGREIPVEIGLAPVETESGLYVVATIADLSERREAEARFRVVVEASPIGIAMVDDRGVIILTNRSLEQLFGYGPDELLNQPLEQLVPPRFRERHPEYRASYSRDPRPRAMGEGRELYGLRKDGTEVAVEIGLAPISTEDGTFVLATVVDITERARADARFRGAVESAPNAMVMVDAQGRVVLANSRAAEIFGYPEGALVDAPIGRLIPSRFRVAHPAHRQSYFESPRARPMGADRDLFALRRDGSEFPVEIGLNPLQTAEGTFVLASIIDISERKRARELRELDAMSLKRSHAELRDARQELEHTVAELQRRSEALDELAHAVSHELKSPLRGIAHLAQWIAEDAGMDMTEQVRRWLGEIEGRVADMDLLLDALGAHARSIRATAGLEEIDTGALVDELVVQCGASEGFILGHVGPRARLRTERRPLRRVLQQLIDNALRHHDRQAGEVCVAVEEVAGDRVRFEVRDDGPGIARPLRARSFGLFKRLSGGSRGGGVGLATVKQMVESRGGTITIHDNQPRGSIFRFTWPVEEVRWLR